MPTINSVNVKITGDESGLKQASKEAQSDIGKVGSAALSIGKLALGNALGFALTNVVGKAIGAVTREMDGAISRLDTINNYSKVMGNLGIGADDSAKSIDYLQEHLLGLPTALDDAALAVQRFTATNGNIKASTVGYLALNNAILAGGASMETQRTAMEQLTQAYSKGKPDAMEWRSMLTAMPAQMNQIAKAAGYSSAVIGGDFYNAIQDGKFSMNDFMATAVKLNTQGVAGFASFEEQARNATGGVQTSIANLKNAIQRGIATVLDTIGQANIAGFINGIAAAIGTVANYIAAFVRLIKEAVAWLGVLFGFKVGGSGKTADATKSTATNLAAADKSAGGVAGGLNKAAGAAKKLNNQLASFDEMNVLRETTSGGSGSGGGGGAVGAGAFAVPEIDWGLDDAKKKENQIEKIFNKLKKFFSNFAKALKPIITVIADIWKSYLQPFLEWAGTTLLPAVFNAISGAVQFLGEVIASVWGKLKPFIDNFLVPIAQWTGGVIVGVLNAIGDALRWCAENQGVVDLFSSLAMAIGVATAALVAWNAAAGFFNAANLALGAKLAELPVLFTQTKIGAGAAKAGMEAFGAASSAATVAGTGLKGTIGAIASAIGPAVLIMEALAAVAASVALVLEALKLKTMQAEAAERLRVTAVKKETEASQMNADAIQRQIDLKNELKDIEYELADANLALLNAQEATAKAMTSADAIARKYGMTTEQARQYTKGLDIASGELTTKDRELIRAISELESAEGRQRAATEKVTEATNKQSEASEQLDNQKWKEIATQKEAEMMAMIAERRYQDVADALVQLSEETGEYQLANGEMVKFTKQDMEDMADFIGQQMAQINTDAGYGWNGVWTAADHTVKNLKAKSSEMVKDARGIGQNYAIGIKDGIIARSGDVLNMGGWLGSQLSASFKKVLGIHSPSRVMAEAGEFIVMGIEQGMENQEGALLHTTENLGKALTSAFDANVQLPEMVGAEAADKLDALAGRAQARLDINSENTAGAIESLANAIIAMQEDKQPIVVKVGEETLVDTMIEGINNASTMRNRGVINI